jgi:prepilin-type N-terminal cleavage/methylation domain-containing protein
MDGVRSRGRGFTLIELLAVIGLLGMLLFFVVPNLDSMTPRARLKSAARRIGAAMETTQGMAISTGQEFTLAYDISHGTFWIIVPPPAAAAGATGTTPVSTPQGTATTPTSGTSSGQVEVPLTGTLPDVESDPPPLNTSPAGSTGSSGTVTTTNPFASSSPSSTANGQASPTALPPDTIGEGIQIQAVDLASGSESTSGVVYVNFSSIGNEGSHSVTLQIASQNGFQSTDTPISVRFNALTRTVDYANQKLGFGGGN